MKKKTKKEPHWPNPLSPTKAYGKKKIKAQQANIIRPKNLPKATTLILYTSI
jgi:hypothetical protein